MYQDLSARHDWPVKKFIVDLPIRIIGNWKRISGNSLSPLRAQNKDIGAASQTLLAGVKFRLRGRLWWTLFVCVFIFLYFPYSKFYLLVRFFFIFHGVTVKNQQLIHMEEQS